jgi:hypothetical protein
MRNIISIVSVGLIGAGAVVACSSGGSNSGGDGGSSSSGGDGGSGLSMSGMQSASDIANSLCTKLNSCTAFYIQSAFGDLGTCQSREASLFAEAFAAKGSGWTPVAIHECALVIPETSCDDALGHHLPVQCHPPAGQLASGATCGDSAQCSSGYCNLGPGGKCGTCAAGLGAAGATCYRDDDCAFGTVCVGNDVTASPAKQGHCTALGEGGATCDDAHPCLKTYACHGNTSTGMCAGADGAGSNCNQVGTDFSGNCDQLSGDYCSKATGGACTQIALVSAGQPCGVIGNVLHACSASGMCRGAGSSSSCVAPAADFGNCDAKNGPGCMAPAQCIGGACIRPSPATCN